MSDSSRDWPWPRSPGAWLEQVDAGADRALAELHESIETLRRRLGQLFSDRYIQHWIKGERERLYGDPRSE